MARNILTTVTNAISMSYWRLNVHVLFLVVTDLSIKAFGHLNTYSIMHDIISKAVTQLVKNILLSYETRRFITVFTKARHWTLS